MAFLLLHNYTDFIEPVGRPDRQRQDLRRPPRDAFRHRDLCPQGLAGPPRHGRAHHL